MTKKPTPATGKLANMKVAFVGKLAYGRNVLDELKSLVTVEGGVVVDGVKTAPDYLVAGRGVRGNPPAAVARIQKKHPHVQVVDQAGFYQLINPTVDELKEMIQSGLRDYTYWDALNSRLCCAGTLVDLSGADFRDRTIDGILEQVCLDNCDFRGAKISARFKQITGAHFDGAVFTDGSFTNAQHSSLKRVTMNGVCWYSTVFQDCDFSDALLRIHGYYTSAIDCSFKRADLRGINLGKSDFKGCDFSSAKLTEAHLEQTAFRASNLSKADFRRANLLKANLANCDLRKATFRDAMLCGADLTGAKIDGADFKGANLTNANLTDLDLSVAKNLVLKEPRTAGPNILELAMVAGASQKLHTTIDVDLGADRSVTLSLELYHYGNSTGTSQSYTNHRSGRRMATSHSSMGGAKLEQAMLDLADWWARGTPTFETVTVNAKKAPVRGKALRGLATAAWFEAFRVPVPTMDQLRQLQR